MCINNAIIKQFKIPNFLSSLNVAMSMLPIIYTFDCTCVERSFLQRIAYANKEGIITLYCHKYALRNGLSKRDSVLSHVINIYIKCKLLQVVVGNDWDTLPTCLIIHTITNSIVLFYFNNHFELHR